MGKYFAFVKPQSENFYPNLFATLILSFLITQIWILSFFPFQDYYEWLLQAKILFNIWRHDVFTNIYYFYDMHPVPPPNTLLTILLGALHFGVSTETAGKIFLSFYILMFVYGFFRYCRKLNKNNPFRFVGLVIVFNFFFYMGFSAYLLGLAVFFLSLPIFFEQRFSHAKKFGQLFWVSLLLYFIHGFTYGLFLITFLTWLITANRRAPQRQHRFFYVVSVLPSLLMMLTYAANLPSPSQNAIEFFPSPVSMLNTLRYGALIFPRVIFTESGFPLSLANGAYLIFMVLIYFSQRKFFQKKSFSAVLFYIFSAFMLLNPIYQIGHFFPPNPRFIPVCILCFCGAFEFSNPNRKAETAILIAAAVLSIFHFIHLRVFDQQTRRLTCEMQTDYNAASAPLVIGKAVIEDFGRSPSHILSPIVQPYVHTQFYFNLDTLNTFLIISPIAIVRMKRHTQSVDKIRFDDLLEYARWRKDIFAAVRDSRERLQKNYDKIFVVGSTDTRTEIVTALSPHFIRKKRFTFWTLLERNPQMKAQDPFLSPD